MCKDHFISQWKIVETIIITTWFYYFKIVLVIDKFTKRFKFKTRNSKFQWKIVLTWIEFGQSLFKILQNSPTASSGISWRTSIGFVICWGIMNVKNVDKQNENAIKLTVLSQQCLCSYTSILSRGKKIWKFNDSLIRNTFNDQTHSWVVVEWPLTPVIRNLSSF